MSAAGFVAEARKLPAFVRRDWKIALSYRAVFLADVLGLATQVIVFYFVAELVDPGTLPLYGGTVPSYLAFVVIGLVVNLTAGVLLYTVAGALRQEQLTGTMEALLATPTTGATLQFGSVAYTLILVPIRATVLLGAISLLFGLDLELSGIPAALVILMCFLPFTWGLGLIAAGLVVTFRRGQNVTGIAVTLLGLISGAVFPIALLPPLLRTIAEWNPFAISIDGVRDALIGGTGWSEALPTIAKLVPLSLAGLALGGFCFRWAMARERRRGTLGMY
ncbi:ABC transporter permease [Solirubrobacter soli]|uniref:ABC transporter permease n=1 Tax=Solirubrobacter soli TaxID=363832 RepID=UPI000423FD4E|nr:ABC transporter permease [Solirubrobacter soli]